MKTGNKYLGWIDVSGNALPPACVALFKELDEALVCVNSRRKDLNPLQRQLTVRFITIYKAFIRELLAANSNLIDLPTAFDRSAQYESTFRAKTHAAGKALVDDICNTTYIDLERIGATVQRALTEGILDAMAEIRAAQNEALPHCKALDAIILSLRYLAHQVDALFEGQIYILREHQLVNEAESNETGDKAKATCLVTAEKFMNDVKPRVRPPTLRERLGPYIPHLVQLRDSGYSYAQCAQFMLTNNINIAPEKISYILRDTHARPAPN